VTKNVCLLLALIPVVILNWMLCACARFGKANVLNARANGSVISTALALQISYKPILRANQGTFYFSQAAEEMTSKWRGRRVAILTT
jgi:hypothetical protein